MQHSSYITTSKHYVDRKEVAKQMVKNGFQIFNVETKKTLQKDTPDKKKASHFCKALIIMWRITESNR